jgi:hypothetical protein
MDDPHPIIWQSQCQPGETGRDLAARFVSEFFGVERSIRWGKTPGEFWFADGAWKYQLTTENGTATIRRSGEQSPRGKAYSKARRRQK